MTGTVHVCWSPHSKDTSRTDWLDTTEMGRVGRLKKRGDRQRFLTSRVLLKTMIGHLSDCDPALVRLSYDCPGCSRPHGRPIVVEPRAAVRWHVSLSHAGRYVMTAATDVGPVGVDVEQVAATRFDGFDDVALTPAERAEVERYAPAEQAWARAVYWSRKEAVLKAIGLGLSVDPRTLQMSAPHLPAALTAWRLNEPPPAVQITDVPVEDDTADGKAVNDGVDDDNMEDEQLVAAVAVLADSPCEVALQPPWGSGRGQIW